MGNTVRYGLPIGIILYAAYAVAATFLAGCRIQIDSNEWLVETATDPLAFSLTQSVGDSGPLLTGEITPRYSIFPDRIPTT